MQALRNNPRHKDIEHFEFNLVNGEPSDPSFKWEEENEFSFRGRMYDVIEKKQEGNKFIIACVNDTKEDVLINELSGIQKERNSKPLKGGPSLYFLFGLFFSSGENIGITPPGEEIISYNFCYNISFSSISADIQTPPPRI